MSWALLCNADTVASTNGCGLVVKSRKVKFNKVQDNVMHAVLARERPSLRSVGKFEEIPSSILSY